MTISIKIGVIHMPPLATDCALDDVCPQRGLAMDAAKIACENLNLNCQFEWFNSTDYGDIDDNGIATGMAAAIINGTYDTSLPVFTPTCKRFRNLSFSETYFYFETVLTTRAPSNAKSLIDWSLINGFDPIAWSLFLVQLILCVLLIRIILHKTTFLARTELDLVRNRAQTYFEIAMSLIMNDYPHEILRSAPIRLCYGAWLLASLVLTSSYTGMLFTQKVLRSNDVPFTDLDTFAACFKSGRCRIITHTKSISFIQQLTVSGSQMADRIEKALTYNPIIVMPLEKIPSAILDENNFYYVWSWPRDWVYYSTNANADCRYYIVETPFLEIDAFPLRKDSQILLKALNRMAKPFMENSLDYGIRLKYFQPAVCNDRTQTSTKTAENDLFSVRTIFYFYTLGILVGFLAVAIEMAVAYVKNRIVGGYMRIIEFILRN